MLNQVALVGEVVEMPEQYEEGTFFLKVMRFHKESNGYFTSDLVRCTVWKGGLYSVREAHHLGHVISVSGRLVSAGAGLCSVLAEKVDYVSRRSPSQEMEGIK
ncbi:MAG: hypothetical protein WCS53_03890 [Bacilli bacterium]|jgi:single-stranded DNA-binding protein